MRRLLFLSLIVLAVSAIPTYASSLGICYGIAGNLVQNCGFETGLEDFSNWTVPGQSTGITGVECQNPPTSIGSPNSGMCDAYSGDYQVDTISQTISGLNIGDNYQLSAYIADDPDNSFGASTWSVSFGGNVIDSGDDSGSGGYAYTLKSYIVNAAATSATIQFGFEQHTEYYDLDDVSLVDLGAPSATPEPAAYLLVSGALLGFGMFRRKKRQA